MAVAALELPGELAVLKATRKLAWEDSLTAYRNSFRCAAAARVVATLQCQIPGCIEEPVVERFNSSQGAGSTSSGHLHPESCMWAGVGVLPGHWAEPRILILRLS